MAYSPGAGDIPLEYQIPEHALGEPDIDPVTVVALGVGGEITLSFAPYAVLNQTDADILIYTPPNDDELAQADVFVSQDGATWYLLDRLTESAMLDLSTLAWIRYIRIVDITADESDSIGFALAGVTGLSCTLEVQTPQILPTVTPTPTSTATTINDETATFTPQTETFISTEKALTSHERKNR